MQIQLPRCEHTPHVSYKRAFLLSWSIQATITQAREDITWSPKPSLRSSTLFLSSSRHTQISRNDGRSHRQTSTIRKGSPRIIHGSRNAQAYRRDFAVIRMQANLCSLHLPQNVIGQAHRHSPSGASQSQGLAAKTKSIP